MLTNVKTVPVKYKAGTYLNSIGKKSISGQTVEMEIPVGAEFTVPENMKKVFVTEKFGNIVIDRCFMQIGNKNELFPIYIKIYDNDESPVLLMKNGIHALLNELNEKSKQTEFSKDTLFSVMLSEIYAIDRTLYESIQEYNDSPRIMNLEMANDEIVFENGPTPDGEPEAEYPWNSANVVGNGYGFYISDTSDKATRIANHLYDTSLYVNIIDAENSYPVFTELENLFSPKMGDNYSCIALDPLTSVSMHESAITKKDLFKNATHKYAVPENRLELEKDDYEYITEFNSEILMLCVWISQLPFSEIAFTYTLPIKNRIENVKNARFTRKEKLEIIRSVTKTNFVFDKLKFMTEFSRIINSWDLEGISSFGIVKTATDELIIFFNGNKRKSLYIDLSITKLISQGIVRLD